MTESKPLGTAPAMTTAQVKAVADLVEHWREVAANYKLSLRESGTLLFQVITIKGVGWANYNINKEGEVVKVSTTFKGDLGDRTNVIINMTMGSSIGKLDLDKPGSLYWNRTTIKPPKKDDEEKECRCVSGCGCGVR